MKLEFTKMHGLGNDFVIINALQRPVTLDAGQIRRMADRHTGIGFDQLLVLQPSTSPSADFMYRVYNADGSEGGQSGNGARCVGRYIQENSIVEKEEITAQTVKGEIHIYFEGKDAIRVDMGMPRFAPDDIPIAAQRRQPSYSLDVAGRKLEFSALSMGNPHAVMVVNDIATAEVEKIGRQFQADGFFPESVNVGFMQIIDRDHILLRVYERGAGETLACGTGACAAVVAGIMDKRLDKEVTVGLKTGKLVISWEGEGSVVWMTGPASTVFEGQINL
jgi:diaminopimelate epimerase